MRGQSTDGYEERTTIGTDALQPPLHQDPPAPTIPAMPKIQSNVPPENERLPQVISQRRELPTWVHRSVRRDMAAANSTIVKPRDRHGDTLPPPTIIPGDPTKATSLHALRRRGPRSRMTHLLVFTITMGLVLVMLYAVSPLTVGVTDQLAAFSGNVTSYNVPTPTPTTAPQPASSGGVYVSPYPANPGTQAIINEITSVFGPYAQGALNVARCESGFNPQAYNPTPVLGSHAMGVFQILYPITWQGTSEAGQSPYNANANILAAHQIFARDGYSWREWACSSR